MRNSWACVAILFGVSAVCSSQMRPAPNCVDTRAIEEYCKRIDASVKKQQGRTFINVSREQGVWREANVTTEDESAVVHNLAHGIARVDFTFQTESGDWVLSAAYYFRADGTIAQKRERLNTFYGNMSVLRGTTFDCRGKTLRQVTKYLDLKTQQPTQPSPDFVDETSPTFKDVTDLPFYGLLQNRR